MSGVCAECGAPAKRRLCDECGLVAIFDACAEDVLRMSDDEIEAELRAEGVDVERYKARVRAILDEALAKRKAQAS